MNVSILYGKDDIPLELPEHTRVIEPEDEPGLPDEMAAVRESMQQPIGSKPLRDRVRAEDKVAIVISDITRPTPDHIMIPAIVAELPHVPHENFVVINGTGTHRDQTDEEFRVMVGDWAYEHLRIINHHCHEKDELALVGESRFGCDVYLNKEYVEADFRITTGFIEPHFFAGFSGGPKGNMPGIAGIETILTFHNARMIGDPNATWGLMEGNPVQEMSREVNHLCPPHFLLNVTLNGKKEITNVFSGDWEEAHAEGCTYTKEHAMAPCEDRFDVVITSNSGYPLDQNLYQAVKGMSAAQKIVKEGGDIIVAAECADGIPDHGNFAHIFSLASSPQELLDMINNPEFSMFDQWQVQKQAVIQTWADVHVHSKLSAEQVEQAMLHYCGDIAETLEQLRTKHGSGMRVAVLPQGPLTIPYVTGEV
ncbi:nickel-dependent lactate racemase [Alkalicoccus chagannorensis]|uniref:nickel-dependent lactate racemase n=1 Tax=Alkalicoccus chagannorensis TaxID=427072 RepID=UPI0003FF9F79|nr:nickel-dependent lactate racemase [Alkalicoccus chagannorensis]